jgi:hypothetical protein
MHSHLDALVFWVIGCQENRPYDMNTSSHCQLVAVRDADRRFQSLHGGPRWKIARRHRAPSGTCIASLAAGTVTVFITEGSRHVEQTLQRFTRDGAGVAPHCCLRSEPADRSETIDELSGAQLKKSLLR